MIKSVREEWENISLKRAAVLKVLTSVRSSTSYVKFLIHVTNCFNSENIIFKMELFASANCVVVEAKMEEDITDPCKSSNLGSGLIVNSNLGLGKTVRRKNSQQSAVTLS